MKNTSPAVSLLSTPEVRRGLALICVASLLVGVGGFAAARGDDEELKVEHADCAFFGPQRARFVSIPPNSAAAFAPSALTAAVTAQLPPSESAAAAPAANAAANDATASTNTIDTYIFQALSDAGVYPAPSTTDYEFIRRVTLDLTGRIPTADRVTSFVADTTPAKRAKLVDELIAKPEFLDKWVNWFGDLYNNNSRNTQIPRFVPGVLAFNSYVRASLQNNKPYDQMARELIAAAGTNSYAQGEINFLVGGVVTGGPIQDVWDQQTANTAETFLGISHLNCLLCHNGRGHLDQLSLWGSQQTRQQAWGMASFMSHTDASRTPVQGATGGLPYYWGLQDNTRYKTDYALNTTTGNRPARQPSGTGGNTVPPQYIFTGDKPKSGENYRASLGRMITSDFQFARATVNYFWEYFFGIGLVSPSNQFDPARLDPDNPPTDCSPVNPCTLQPSNARLLNALAQDFIDSKYDIKGLMREIVNSRAYQLSSRYAGDWNPGWQTLFARKLVRRLWAEEVVDAIAMSSNVTQTYTARDNSWGPVTFSMQLPEPMNTGNAVQPFLDAFLRGNRDDQPRRPDGSISQALDLMNDNFVISRIRSTGPASSLLAANLNLPDAQLVDKLFMTVLSRHPTNTELNAALTNLKTNRSQEAENLLWSLYNKVDFLFNY